MAGDCGNAELDRSSRRWSALHHGIDPATIPGLRIWLRSVWTVAQPLQRVPPAVISITGAVCAVVAAGTLATVSTVTAVVAIALMLASVLCDALDGAVAIVANRASRFGALLDSWCDRIADLAFVAVIWRCGASLWLAALTAVGVLCVEGWRILRGGPSRAVVTVAERPTRLVCAVLAVVSVLFSTARWPATVCAGVLLGLSVIALFQLIHSGHPQPGPSARVAR